MVLAWASIFTPWTAKAARVSLGLPLACRRWSGAAGAVSSARGGETRGELVTSRAGAVGFRSGDRPPRALVPSTGAHAGQEPSRSGRLCSASRRNPPRHPEVSWARACPALGPEQPTPGHGRFVTGPRGHRGSHPPPGLPVMFPEHLPLPGSPGPYPWGFLCFFKCLELRMYLFCTRMSSLRSKPRISSPPGASRPGGGPRRLGDARSLHGALAVRGVRSRGPPSTRLCAAQAGPEHEEGERGSLGRGAQGCVGGGRGRTGRGGSSGLPALGLRPAGCAPCLALPSGPFSLRVLPPRGPLPRSRTQCSSSCLASERPVLGGQGGVLRAQPLLTSQLAGSDLGQGSRPSCHLGTRDAGWRGAGGL